MGLFSKNEVEAPATESGIPRTEGDQGGLTLAQGIEEKKRGRGRPPGSGGKSRAGAVPDGLPPDSGIGVEELYKAENWEEVAALPFNVRKAMTGSEVFELSKKQKEVLGRSLAASMRLLGVIDPKYVALVLFGVNLSTIWAEKEILYRLEKGSANETPAA